MPGPNMDMPYTTSTAVRKPQSWNAVKWAIVVAVVGFCLLHSANADNDDDDSNMGVGKPGIYEGVNGMGHFFGVACAGSESKKECQVETDVQLSTTQGLPANEPCKWSKPLTEANDFQHRGTADGKQCTRAFQKVSADDEQYGGHLTGKGDFLYGHGNDPRQNDVFELKVIDVEKYPKAKCLDGSAATFYFKRGFYGAKTKWLIHLQGGGWCISWEDCVQRSKTFLGSSNGNADRLSFTQYGPQFSSDESINPVLFQHNMVLIPYCDGASFGGTAGEVEAPDGTKLHFAGKYIMEAVFKTLNDTSGVAMVLPDTPEELMEPSYINVSTSIVVNGCSAGGLAVFMHCDQWVEWFETATTADKMLATCLPEDGVFLQKNSDEDDHRKYATVDGELDPYLHKYKNGYRRGLEWSWDVQKLEDGGGHAACIQAYKDNNEPTNNCYFAQNLFDFVKTRTFSIHQKYDSWAIPHVLGLQPDVDNLHADIDPDKRIALYGKEVVDHTINRHMNPRREGHNGFFMTSYYSHCNGRETAKIDGYTALEAFQEWYKFLDQRNPTADDSGKSRSNMRFSMHNHGMWIQDYSFPCRTCGDLRTTQDDTTKTAIMQLRSSATATFDGSNGVEGVVYFSFVGSEPPFDTQVTVQLTGLDDQVDGWKVYSNAINSSSGLSATCGDLEDIVYDPHQRRVCSTVPASECSEEKYSKNCGEAAEMCQIGDLDSKIGAIEGSRTYTSSFLPLTGATSIIGRSVVVQRNGAPWACANIVAETDGLSAKVDSLQAQLLEAKQTVATLQASASNGEFGGGVTNGKVVGIIIGMDLLIVVLVALAYYGLGGAGAGAGAGASKARSGAYDAGAEKNGNFANPLAMADGGQSTI